MDFREADRRYVDLKRQFDNGNLSNEDFDEQLKQMMVQDDEGRWWAKSRETGEWHFYDGNTWIRGTLPGATTVQETPLPQSPSTQGASSSGRSRAAPTWAVAIGALLIALLVGTGALAYSMIFILDTDTPDAGSPLAGEGSLPPEEAPETTRGFALDPNTNKPDEGPPPPEEASGPAPGYALVTDGSGNLSAEVPSDWDEQLTGTASEYPGEGEGWSSFLGETVSASITAAPDLATWHGSFGMAGTYVVASRELAQEYTDEQLVASGPNDYSSSCQPGTRQDFDQPPYEGAIQEWNNCAGNPDSGYITASAAPEGRECVVLLQIGVSNEANREVAQHILDTFEVDCRGI